MVVAVAALAVLAGLLALLLVRERRRAVAAHADAERLRVDLDTARATADEATASAAAARADAEAAHAEAETQSARADTAEAAADQAHAQAEAAGDRAVEAESERLTLLGSLSATEQQLADAVDAAAAAIAERDELTGQVVPLRERLLELEAQSSRTLTDHRPGIEAEALWQLELARSERTWRHSVAAAPDGPGPFVAADDPLRTAVEIEVAALREDVGAAMELTWDTDVDDPARCLTVLRLAQELLSAAAREQQAVVLDGRQEPDGAVVLHLTVPEGHPPLSIGVPPLPDHLVSVRTDDGLQVTVR